MFANNLCHFFVFLSFCLFRSSLQEEAKKNVFQQMRIQRADARMVGVRQRKADEAAAKEALKKKK
jgi:hypothetical protein